MLFHVVNERHVAGRDDLYDDKSLKAGAASCTTRISPGIMIACSSATLFRLDGPQSARSTST